MEKDREPRNMPTKNKISCIPRDITSVKVLARHYDNPVLISSIPYGFLNLPEMILGTIKCVPKPNQIKQSHKII